SHLGLVRNSGTRLDVACLLQQNCCRRSLCDEAERSVCVNCDNNRDDHSVLICGSCVELLCELNDVHTVLSKSRTYRRSRCCLSSRNLQFNITCYFLCHFRHLLVVIAGFWVSP